MKKSFLLYGLLLCVIAGSAWMIAPADKRLHSMKPLVMAEEFSFIKYDKNKLDIQPANSKWDRLFDKFERLAFNGTGKISVVHIGGSHVQGGFLTDKMRENFTSLVYGARGERGFIFPFDMAKSNGPKSIKANWTGNWTGCRNSVSKDECLWGVSGISATCYDRSASVSIAALSYDSIPYSFSSVRIYYQSSPNVQIALDTLLTIHREFHDPAGGFSEYSFSPAIETLNFGYHTTDSLSSWFTFQGAYLGSGNNGLTYNAIGVNGASTRSYLRCDLFDEQLTTLKPDLAIFGIGVNDANVPEGDFDAALYEARYDTLISSFLNANPDACVLFVTNNDTYYQKKYPNKNALKVQDSMYRLAAKYDGAVYDLFEIMGGLGSIKQWQHAQLAASDKIHLSKKGYELQADLMTIAFREAFGDYLDRKYAR
jgi:lysophospholipase L1-like esterase